MSEGTQLPDSQFYPDAESQNDEPEAESQLPAAVEGEETYK